jgi:hypothetical protein
MRNDRTVARYLAPRIHMSTQKLKFESTACSVPKRLAQ